MHFAAGMGCAGVGTVVVCTIMRRGWRWIPATMTLGGLWAILPDMPRVFREDFPNAPLAGVLGAKTLEKSLHRWGDLFCFHNSLDAQPAELALAGFALTLLLYNAGLLLLMVMESRQRNSPANQLLHAHGVARLRDFLRKSQADIPPPDNDPDGPDDTDAGDDPDVIYKIRPSKYSRAR